MANHRENAGEKHRVLLVGPKNLRNDALQYAIKRGTRYECSLCPDADNLPGTEERVSVALVDYEQDQFAGVLESVHRWSQKSAHNTVVAAFNVNRNLEVVRMALQRGVRGIFYPKDELGLLLRGIEALRRGEIWLPRSTLFNLATTSPDHSDLGLLDAPLLTRRETEIVYYVSTGRTNKEISDILCISPHTVKTHLYTIYKKINVSNRFQASLWAAKNL